MLYLLLAEGFEETEAVAPLDIIRRAEIPIKTAGVGGRPVTGTHGIEITADCTVDEINADGLDGIILPGGMPGTLNLQKDGRVIELLKLCEREHKLIAAICAAPMILGELGMLDGRAAVCFPGFEDSLEGAVVSDESVVRDDNFITAKGAGAALLFGAEIVDYFCPQEGTGKGRKLMAQMQVPGYVR